MQLRSLLVLLLGTLVVQLSVIGAAEELEEKSPEGPSDVIILSHENLTQALENNPFIMVEFYAPWCGHCKALAPEYEKLATALKTTNFPVAKVDCTATGNKEACEKQEVKGYPTIKFFRRGVPLDYQGAREADSMELYIKKQLKENTELLTSSEQLTKAIKGAEVVAIGFFESNKSPEYESYLNASRINADAEFYEVFDVELAKSQNAKPPVVLLFRDFDTTLNTDNFTDFVNLSDWITDNSVDELTELEEVAFEVLARKMKYVAILFTSDDNATRDAELAIMKEVLTLHPDVGVLHTTVSGSGGLFEEVSPNAAPPYLAPLELEKQRFYVFDLKEFTKESLSQYLDDLKSKKLKLELKSEPIPKANDGNVTIVVGLNFKQVVLDNDKDVLLEVYAPWCGHCKKFEPEYDKIAFTLQKNPTVVVAKVDGTENDLPLTYEGFPTIFFFAGNNKSVDAVLTYKGGRDHYNVVKFVKKHASHPIKANPGIDPRIKEMMGESAGAEYAETLEKLTAELGEDGENLDLGLDSLFPDFGNSEEEDPALAGEDHDHAEHTDDHAGHTHDHAGHTHDHAGHTHDDKSDHKHDKHDKRNKHDSDDKHDKHDKHDKRDKRDKHDNGDKHDKRDKRDKRDKHDSDDKHDKRDKHNKRDHKHDHAGHTHDHAGHTHDHASPSKSVKDEL
eukprot:TRINITY_DN2260_c0_g1_i4.p1 TRINITY_DN2260_c0_g1~~TRINITY_DN2260_c0_g1_i4.p1  ORF type:complete len:677 (-),score=159.13 TRINITY_DN2260_c0_g1_i4:86-2116(-)